MKKRHLRNIILSSLMVGASLLSAACDEPQKVRASNDGAELNYQCPTRVYGSCTLAPSLQSLSGMQLYDILGPTIVDKGVNFAVYAKNATRVEVLIFNTANPDTDQPAQRIPMYKDETTGIWTQFVYGVGVGTYYGYIAFGPNWVYKPEFYPGSTIGFIEDCDKDGNRYNPNKLLTDPYARRIHRDFDWGAGGNPASGTARDISDWKSSPKSVVIKSEYEWSDAEKQWRQNRMLGDRFVGHAKTDLIFYEVHPKGFTMKAMDDVKNPGTWKGIGEKAEYLKKLGITAVELMPVGEKPDDGTYWGYNTINFFVPEQRFATRVDQGKMNGVHDEFKEMVDKLHQAGIEVILDVVYNHTGEGGFWRSKIQDPANSYGTQANFDDRTAATIYSFRGLDNSAYYHLVSDNNGNPNHAYLDQTGVGNQTRTNVLPFRRLIVDNLRFWVEEMHVDGFRFDLASILGVDDKNVYADNNYWMNNVKNTVLQDIIDDEVMAKYHTRFIAEPWDISHYVNGLFPKSTKFENHAWFEWNGRFRDMYRPFVNNDDYTLSRTESISPNWDQAMNIGNLLTGSSVFFGDDGRKPYNSVNFLTAHDGMTLYDLATYWEKNNGCSKLNDVCCNSMYNSFCDVSSGEEHNASRNWCQDYDNANYDTQGRCYDSYHEALKRQIIRDFFALLMVSHGSPMILGGDEYMRTQYGNNNAYSDSADNEWNWFRWGDWTSTPENERMRDFVSKAIAIRKQFKEFLSPAEYGSPVEWWWPEGTTDDNGWQGKSLAMHYRATATTPALYVMINMEAYDTKRFYLPDGGEWSILMDTQSYFDYEYLNSEEGAGKDKKLSQNVWIDGSRRTQDPAYDVKPRTIVIATKR